MIVVYPYFKRASWLIQRWARARRPKGSSRAQGPAEFDPIEMEGRNLDGLASSGCYGPILHRLLRDAAPLSGLMVNAGAGFCKKSHFLGKEDDWLGEKCRYVGIDISPKVRPDIVGNIENLESIATGAACLLISTEALFYVKRPEIAISEIKRVLRPGGYLFMVEPMLYPRKEKPGRWCMDRNRFFSNELLHKPSVAVFLKRFSEWFGVRTTYENLREVMRLDLYGLSAYRVYDIDELLGNCFSKIATCPLYNSPQDNTIQVLLLAKRTQPDK